MISADLIGKTVLVIGGVSGIGLAPIEIFGESGARVAVNPLPDDAGAERVAARLQEERRDIVAAPGDVSVPGRVRFIRDTPDGGVPYQDRRCGSPRGQLCWRRCLPEQLQSARFQVLDHLPGHHAVRIVVAMTAFDWPQTGGFAQGPFDIEDEVISLDGAQAVVHEAITACVHSKNKDVASEPWRDRFVHTRIRLPNANRLSNSR